MSNKSDDYSTTTPLLKSDNYSTIKKFRKRNYGTTTNNRRSSSSININDNDSNGGGGGSSSVSEVLPSTSSLESIEQQQQQHRSTLSFIQKFGFGLGHIYNDLCATVWFSYTLLFLQSILLIPAPKAGALVMLGQISDALATPIIGILSDRFGTKRQWHIYGTIFVFLSFPMIFSLCPWCNNLPEWWTLIYFSIFIIIFQLSWACVQITHLSMIPEMSITENDRSDLTATRYSASVCSNVIVYVITWGVLKGRNINNNNNNIGPLDGYRFRDISLILTLIGLTMTVLFHFSLALSGYEKRRLLYINNNNNQIIVSTSSSSSLYDNSENKYKCENSNNNSNNEICDKKLLLKNNEKKISISSSSNDSNDDDNENNVNNISTQILPELIQQQRQSIIINYKNIFKSKLLYQNALLYVFARLFMTTSLVYMPLWLDQQTYIQKNIIPTISTKIPIIITTSNDLLIYYNESINNNNNNYNYNQLYNVPITENNSIINVEHLATIPLVSFLSSFIASIILKNFNIFLNHKIGYLIGSLISLIGCIWIILSSTTAITIIKLYLIAILFGSGSSITMITSLCITADMIGGNTYQGGFIYSTVTFADKLITGIVIVIIETMKCENRSDCPLYYQNVLSYGCGLASILGIIILISLKCNKKPINVNNSNTIV